MQRYYRTVMDVSLLNEMLLQLFREAILDDGEPTIVPLNPRFQVAQRLPRGRRGRRVRAAPFGHARAVPHHAGAPGAARRARHDHPRCSAGTCG
ncbi:MAG: hypothetical protein MZV65_53475 [Chromatiales bacterium]|nr:hypothetical protein [Chromatiales bacterium]